MPECKYGQCTARNLCQNGNYCVREELERDGYTITQDGHITHAASHVPEGRRECPCPELEDVMMRLAPGEYRIIVTEGGRPLVDDAVQLVQKDHLLVKAGTRQITFQRPDALPMLMPPAREKEKEHGRR